MSQYKPKESFYKKLLNQAYGMQAGTNDLQCPRGKVSVMLLGENMDLLSTGQNFLAENQAPCECNDDTDTMKHGSQTCKAKHAEIAALDEASRLGVKHLGRILITTRPPCQECMTRLYSSGIHTIVTSDQYPDRDKTEIIWFKGRGNSERKWHTFDHTELDHFKKLGEGA